MNQKLYWQVSLRLLVVIAKILIHIARVVAAPPLASGRNIPDFCTCCNELDTLCAELEQIITENGFT